MTRKDKIKAHFEDHKQFYIGLGIGLGLAGITWVIVKDIESSKRIDRGISVVADRGISVVADRSVIRDNVFQVFDSRRRGAPSWVVQCLETGDVYKSQREAADVMGLPASELSQHLNGVMEHVRGHTFKRIALAA